MGKGRVGGREGEGEWQGGGGSFLLSGVDEMGKESWARTLGVVLMS